MEILARSAPFESDLEGLLPRLHARKDLLGVRTPFQRAFPTAPGPHSTPRYMRLCQSALIAGTLVDCDQLDRREIMPQLLETEFQATFSGLSENLEPPCARIDRSMPAWCQRTKGHRSA